MWPLNPPPRNRIDEDVDPLVIGKRCRFKARNKSHRWDPLRSHGHARPDQVPTRPVMRRTLRRGSRARTHTQHGRGVVAGVGATMLWSAQDRPGGDTAREGAHGVSVSHRIERGLAPGSASSGFDALLGWCPMDAAHRRSRRPTTVRPVGWPTAWADVQSFGDRTRRCDPERDPRSACVCSAGAAKEQGNCLRAHLLLRATWNVLFNDERAIIMLVISLVAVPATLGLAVLLTWPICMIWAVTAVDTWNRTHASLSAPVPGHSVPFQHQTTWDQVGPAHPVFAPPPPAGFPVRAPLPPPPPPGAP